MLPLTLGLAAGKKCSSLARPRGLLRELKCCCVRGFYLVWVYLFRGEGLFKCPARGFYDLLLFIDVICMVLRRFLDIAGLHVGFIGSW